MSHLGSGGLPGSFARREGAGLNRLSVRFGGLCAQPAVRCLQRLDLRLNLPLEGAAPLGELSLAEDFQPALLLIGLLSLEHVRDDDEQLIGERKDRARFAQVPHLAMIVGRQIVILAARCGLSQLAK